MRLLLFSFLALFTLSAQAIESGTLAPEFSLQSSAGKIVKLSDYKGKTIVLEWFNKGCPFVQKHYKSKNMQSLQAEFTKKGVIWLSIISSAPGKEGYETAVEIENTKREMGMNSTAILIDSNGKVAKAFKAETTPHMYIIDVKGKLVYQGAIDDKPSTDLDDIKGAKNYVSEALNELLSGNKVKISQTKSYGCGVKY